jgi:citrate lyase subunit beta / citryl-CoA lyase
MLTWLYVPGDRPDRFGKAVTSGADAVILDLEDAVAPSRKPYARDAVAEFLTGAHAVPVTVRINQPSGPDAAADLAALTGTTGLAEPPRNAHPAGLAEPAAAAAAGLSGLSGLRLPKVQHPSEVRQAAGMIDTPLHCLIESAAGVEAAYAIATAHQSVASITLGEADLVSDLGVTGEAGLAWPRGRVVVAARAAGLPPPAMSVYPSVSDLDGLAASCATGRRLGFLGRAAIHPRQLPVIVDAFRPSAAEAARARELLAALADAAAHDSGTAVLPDGRFADSAMVTAAARTVAIADRYGTG